MIGVDVRGELPAGAVQPRSDATNGISHTMIFNFFISENGIVAVLGHEGHAVARRSAY